jgi:hypothetical protein
MPIGRPGGQSPPGVGCGLGANNATKNDRLFDQAVGFLNVPPFDELFFDY